MNKVFDDDSAERGLMCVWHFCNFVWNFLCKENISLKLFYQEHPELETRGIVLEDVVSRAQMGKKPMKSKHDWPL